MDNMEERKVEERKDMENTEEKWVVVVTNYCKKCNY